MCDDSQAHCIGTLLYSELCISISIYLRQSYSQLAILRNCNTMVPVGLERGIVWLIRHRVIWPIPFRSNMHWTITFMSIIHQIYIDIWASLEMIRSPLITGLQPLQHPKCSKHNKKKRYMNRYYYIVGAELNNNKIWFRTTTVQVEM